MNPSFDTGTITSPGKVKIGREKNPTLTFTETKECLTCVDE